MKEKVSMRIAYGKALVELGNSNPDVVVLSADVSNSDHSYMFEEEFPDRFINVGIFANNRAFHCLTSTG